MKKFCFTLLMCFVASFVFAGIFYVKPDGIGSGASWSDAAPGTNLGNILANAVDGDEIWLAAGAYLPQGDRSASFSVKPGVSIYGGFAGGENSLDERIRSIDHSGNGIIEPWEFTYLTILDGDIGSQGNVTDNVYSVLKIEQGNNLTTKLDGLVIQNANSTGSGGGILIPGGTGIVGFSLHVSGCIVRNNNANTDGAGLCYVYELSGSDYGNLFIEGSCFYSNQAGAGGGAIAAYRCNTEIVNSLVFNNKAQIGGGYRCTATSSNHNLLIKNSVFHNNSATGSGGGAIFLSGGGVFDCTVINSTFALNAATSGSGACIYSNTAPLYDENVRFINSIAWYNNTGGGTLPDFNALDEAINSAYQPQGLSAASETAVILIPSDSNTGANCPYFVNPHNVPGGYPTNQAFIDILLQTNWQLQSISPFINKGTTDTSPLELPATDMTGLSRIEDGIIDIGAFEYRTLPPPGNALYLAGDPRYVEANSVCNADFTSFTLETWCKFNNVPPSTAYQNAIMCFNDATGGNLNEIFIRNQRFTYFDEEVSYQESNVIVEPNRWYHIALTCDDQNAFKLYINGIVELEFISTVRPDSQSTFSFGQEFDALIPSNFMNGFLDETRIWNNTRTNEEILEYLHKPLLGNETGLIAYYNYN